MNAEKLAAEEHMVPAKRKPKNEKHPKNKPAIQLQRLETLS